MEEEVVLRKSDLLKTHAEGCSDVKKALEKMYPGVFKTSAMMDSSIFIKTGDGAYGGEPYAACRSDELNKFILVCLGSPGRWDIPQLPEFYKDGFRPMISGTITITVRDGKVCGAKVVED